MAVRQMRAETVAKLTDGIAVVEGVLAALGEVPPFGGEDWQERWKAFQKAEREALDLLVRVHGASHSNDSCCERLRIFGVQTTCTSGTSQLMRNWIKAARRRLEGGAS